MRLERVGGGTLEVGLQGAERLLPTLERYACDDGHQSRSSSLSASSGSYLALSWLGVRVAWAARASGSLWCPHAGDRTRSATAGADGCGAGSGVKPTVLVADQDRARLSNEMTHSASRRV